MQQVQERNIDRKGQWIQKAESIINNFITKQSDNTSVDVQILFQAMGIQTERRERRSSNKQQKQTKTNIYKTKSKTTTSIRAFMSNNIKQKDNFGDLR